MQARVTAVERDGNTVAAVMYELDGQNHRIPTQNVWSTLPISLLFRSMSPEAPQEIVDASVASRFAE